jgi:predicted  nucleic acid-binding Zn-ribbon protein
MTLKREIAKLQTRRTQIEQQLKELGAGTDMEIWNEDKIDALEQELGDLEVDLSDISYELEMSHERDWD